MTGKADQNLYDEIPYPSMSYSRSHPDRLATLATLLGMGPPPVERCRVLELGCAGGGNLVPMAHGLPESEFVGIDSSAREIAEGQAAVAALGLKNITFKRVDILDVDAGFGQFDYIIAHGIYSWVPPVVQERILEICRQNLAANGVAYVSYNTYPGWHLLGTIRDMMLYHTRQVTEPLERAAGARALLDFLAQSAPVGDTPHASFVHAYAGYVKECILPKNDAHLLHDELAEVNKPIYFYQFAERAARHGLQYLADAQFQTMLASSLPGEVSEALRHMAKDTIALEQYMDFLRNRTFRQTLLCQQDVPLSARVKLDRLGDFYVASPALPRSPACAGATGTLARVAEPGRAGESDVHSTPVETFHVPDGATLSTDHPVTREAMRYLTEVWPRAVPFNTLLSTARARVNGAGGDSASPGVAGDAEVLGSNLLKAYGSSENLVELHVYAPYFVLEISERPIASPVARFQARKGTRITNLRHERVTLDRISYFLLRYLDGDRDRAALLDALEGLAADGVIEVRQADEPVRDAERARPILEGMLEAKLRQLARVALLVG
jgi:SAM-dependent methyltransferase